MVLGFREIAIHVPLALHCSMMIAAACHPSPDEAEPHLKKVQWEIIRSQGSQCHSPKLARNMRSVQQSLVRLNPSRLFLQSTSAPISQVEQAGSLFANALKYM